MGGGSVIRLHKKLTKIIEKPVCTMMEILSTDYHYCLVINLPSSKKCFKFEKKFELSIEIEHFSVSHLVLCIYWGT